jgi:tetratricopeptide (TPR) repeat protein
VLAMPAPVEEKKVRGKKKKGMKKKKANPRKVEVLDACFALGKACQEVRDQEDAELYLKRAKEGYEEQLGPDSEKALDTTYGLICVTEMSIGEAVEKFRVLVGRMVGALGEENVITLDTLNQLGSELQQNGEIEEARTVYERCLAGQERVLGEDHKKTLMTVNNLGNVYRELKDYVKALEYYERALKGFEKTLGKTHPSTLMNVMNIAIVYHVGLKDYGKAEELYQRALEGYEAQIGKDHEDTKMCARNFRRCLNVSGNMKRLEELKKEFPWL